MATMKLPRTLLARDAAADIAVEKQWHFGKLNASEKVELAGAGDAASVIEEPAKAGMPVTLCLEGVTKVVSGGAIAVDDLITSDANQRGVVATTGDSVNGKALSPASGAGILVTLQTVVGVTSA